MPPLAYCDSNFVVTAHDAPEEYKTHLRELASGGKIKFVLSPWHGREMARDTDHPRGTSVADFCDSLDPLCLYDRRTIQRKEVSAAFFKFANVPATPPAMLGDIGDIIHDLAGTIAYRNCRSLVEHLRKIGSNHPMEKTLGTLSTLIRKTLRNFLRASSRRSFSRKLKGSTFKV